jgi:hypothetical protein
MSESGSGKKLANKLWNSIHGIVISDIWRRFTIVCSLSHYRSTPKVELQDKDGYQA